MTPTPIFLQMNINEFQQLIDQPTKPIIVDFWASWCVPCKITKPILEDLGQEYDGEVRFLAVDVDTSPEIVKKYKVMSIPSVIAFRAGKVVAQVTGAQNKAYYKEMFHSLANDAAFQPKVSSSDRLVRLTAGLLFGIMGIALRNWILIGIGGLIGFWGVYDRCPVWAAITRRLKHEK